MGRGLTEASDTFWGIAMLTIKDERTDGVRPSVDSNDIPAGTFFTGRIGCYSDKYFRKVHQSVVSMESDDGIWSHGVAVHDYQPIDATLIITGNAEATK